MKLGHIRAILFKAKQDRVPCVKGLAFTYIHYELPWFTTLLLQLSHTCYSNEILDGG